MSINFIYVTKEGYEIIQNKIKELTKEKKEISKEIDRCRSEDRNLAESTEYISLREQQGLVEKNLTEFQEKANIAKVISPDDIQDKNKVRFTATVLLSDIKTKENFTFKIVGEVESDVKEGKISYLSPFGKELIGQEVGDIVDLTYKKELKELEIKEIKYI